MHAEEKPSAPVEVYGFAGWVASLVAYAAYLVWAFVPDRSLHDLGITYYPSKYWALAVPCCVFVYLILAIVAYSGACMMTVKRLASPDNITDNFATYAPDPADEIGNDSAELTRTVPTTHDLRLHEVCRALYGI